MTKNYQLRTTTGMVELWLSVRMPLQPTGAMLNARLELQAAIRNLRAPPGHILMAEYFSVDQSFFDVENVLIYNIGTGTFRIATERGLAFVRHRQPPVAAPNGSTYAHLHRYRFVPTPSPTEGHSYRFQVPPLTSTLKPHHVWWLAADALSQAPGPLTSTFSLHVAITTVKSIVNVAAVLKPLLDGVVCAMHSDASPSAEAIRRLAEKGKWDVDSVERKLRASGTPFLGDRRLVEPYREYVKWDPADHLCESCTLLVSTGPEESCTVTIADHVGAVVSELS